MTIWTAKSGLISRVARRESAIWVGVPPSHPRHRVPADRSVAARGGVTTTTSVSPIAADRLPRQLGATTSHQARPAPRRAGREAPQGRPAPGMLPHKAGSRRRNGVGDWLPGRCGRTGQAVAESSYGDHAMAASSSRDLPNPPMQLCARQSQSPCRLRLVAAAIAQDLGNRGSFDDAQIGRVLAELPGAWLQVQMARIDERALADNRSPLQGIAQLADVARPVILDKDGSRLSRQSDRRAAE